MTKEEHAADVVKEKEEKRAAALEEIREEAAEEIGQLRDKAEQYAVVGKFGIDALKTLRPLIADLATLTADELRAFGNDLAPLGKVVDDAFLHLLNRSADQKAAAVARLMTSTSLSEATCLAIVLSSNEAISSAIKNAFDSKDDKKKK